MNPLIKDPINVRSSYASKFLNDQNIYPHDNQVDDVQREQKQYSNAHYMNQNINAGVQDQSQNLNEIANDRNETDSIVSTPNPSTRRLSDQQKESPQNSVNPRLNSSFEVTQEPDACESIVPNVSDQRPSFGVNQMAGQAVMKAMPNVDDLYAQIHNLKNQNMALHQHLQNMQMGYQRVEQQAVSFQQELENERNTNQQKINYLLNAKQEAEENVFKHQEMIQKYATALENLQMHTQNDKDMLNNSSSVLQQQRMREEELLNQIEALSYKLNDAQNINNEQSRQIHTFQIENENLQSDLRGLVNLEQTLRTELNNSFQKISIINELHLEGQHQNSNLNQELAVLREELLKKHQDNNQNATILAEKDNEIFSLKAELARTNALISTQRETQEEPKSNPNKTNLDMLLKQNSENFASEYLRGIQNRVAPEENSLFKTSTPAAQSTVTSTNSNIYEKFGFTGSQAAGMKNKEYKPSTSALPEEGPIAGKNGPKTTQGLPPNSSYKKQEWTPYL